VISTYTDTEAAAVAALLDAAPEVPKTSEASFRSFAGQSFNRGARDFRVFRSGDLCIALMTSTLLSDATPPVRHFRIVVHPGQRREGLGAQLMAVLEKQETLPNTVLQCNSQKSWLAGNAFLEHYGFHVARRELLMRISGTAPSALVPNEFTFRQAAPGDDHAWASLHQHAYGCEGDFSPLTPEDLALERASPGFTLIVAERDGEVVGYCHGLDLDASEGLINSLVVRNDARRVGLGAALLASTTKTLLSNGPTHVSLNVVSDNRPAIALYEKMGFHSYDEILTYHRLHRS
tara:strand:+ start:105687 stop:106559 length:873 start_codon:yes stop_codon:yes gene_type:complete